MGSENMVLMRLLQIGAKDFTVFPPFIDILKEKSKEIPIYLNNVMLKCTTEEKYLGQIIKSPLSISALGTAQDRAGKI